MVEAKETKKVEDFELPEELREYLRKHILTPVDIAKIIQWARRLYHKLVEVERERDFYKNWKTAVSYTHLTLPTN